MAAASPGQAGVQYTKMWPRTMITEQRPRMPSSGCKSGAMTPVDRIPGAKCAAVGVELEEEPRLADSTVSEYRTRMLLTGESGTTVSKHAAMAKRSPFLLLACVATTLVSCLAYQSPHVRARVHLASLRASAAASSEFSHKHATRFLFAFGRSRIRLRPTSRSPSLAASGLYLLACS